MPSSCSYRQIILATLQFHHLIIQVNLVSSAKHSKMSRRHVNFRTSHEKQKKSLIPHLHRPQPKGQNKLMHTA